MIVPQEIRNRTFDRSINGYDENEVAFFIQTVAEEFEELYSENEKQKERLRQLRNQLEIFSETEGKLGQTLELSRRKAADLGEQVNRETERLLEQTCMQVRQTLGSHLELIQRLAAISTGVRSILQENNDFYREEKLPAAVATGQKRFDPEVEIDLARTRVDELLQGLDEFAQLIGEHVPADCREITVQSLLSRLEGDVTPTPLMENEVIESAVFEHANQVKPTVKPPSVPELETKSARDISSNHQEVDTISGPVLDIPWEMPRAGRRKITFNAKSRWLATLVLVIILGLAGGYCWRNDLIPQFPWAQAGNESMAPAGETENQDASPDTSKGSQQTIPPLLEAAMDRDADKVEQLLASGISPDVTNQKGETPLMVAAYQDDSKIVRSLLEAGADPDKKEHEWGVTPLMYAAFQGNLGIVEMLLDYKANLDITNREGWTALMCAAFAGHPKTAQMLVKRGADPYLKNNDGWTAYELALIAERELTTKALENVGVKPEEKTVSRSAFTPNEEMLRLFENQNGR